MEKTNRNYGIDLLRIFSMYLVTVLHILGQGGVLNAAAPDSIQYWIAWLLEISAYCAVNCFALISGYVMYRSKPKLSRILELWLQIFFYGVLITVAMGISFPDVWTLENILRLFFPISYGQYWYLSAYFAMVLFAPILNLAVQKLDKRTLGVLLTGAFLLLCLLPSLTFQDPYALGGGYSAAWLCVLYLAGGYLHQYDVLGRCTKTLSLALFGAAVALTFVSKYFLSPVLQNSPDFPLKPDALISYTSPTIVLCAIALLSFFSKLECNGKWIRRLITDFSAASLGVYIIHIHPLIWHHYIQDIAVAFAASRWPVMACKVFAAAAALYLVCTFIDMIRIRLFSLLKIQSLCKKAGDWFHSRCAASQR